MLGQLCATDACAVDGYGLKPARHTSRIFFLCYVVGNDDVTSLLRLHIYTYSYVQNDRELLQPIPYICSTCQKQNKTTYIEIIKNDVILSVANVQRVQSFRHA